jgi:hypothetical protein
MGTLQFINNLVGDISLIESLGDIANCMVV